MKKDNERIPINYRQTSLQQRRDFMPFFNYKIEDEINQSNQNHKNLTEENISFPTVLAHCICLTL